MTPTNSNFKSVSWAILEPCNMKCKFCFATFNDIKGVENLNAMDYESGCRLLNEIKWFGITKVTFYGGEPTLVKHLGDWVAYAKLIGLTTMLVTNGTRITDEYIKTKLLHLDWIVLSIDSINEATNRSIGRETRDGVTTEKRYRELITMFKDNGKRMKINTVVCAPNKDENMTEFISWAKPERWKLLQCYKVPGQNDHGFEAMEVTNAEFQDYVFRHGVIENVELVPESTEDLDNSYLMIDPKGRFFQSMNGHTYSEPITKVGIEKAYAQVNKDFDTYVKRKGIYEWES